MRLLVVAVAIVLVGAETADEEGPGGKATVKPTLYPIPWERDTPTVLSPFIKPERVVGSHVPAIPDAPCVCGHALTATIRDCVHWVKAPEFECKRVGPPPQKLCFKYGPYLPKHYCGCIHADNKRQCYVFAPPGAKRPDIQYIDRRPTPARLPVWPSASASPSPWITPIYESASTTIGGADAWKQQPSHGTGAHVAVTEYDRDIWTRTIWSEARHDDLFGQRAVAWVILNRARDVGHRFPTTIAAVCKQPGQFHAWSRTSMLSPAYYEAVTMRKQSPEYIAARMIIDGVIDGKIPDPTGGAQFYYAQSPGVSAFVPSWAESMNCNYQSRLHVFCRSRV